MTKRTQFLLPTLLPLIAGLCVTACGEEPTSSNPDSTATTPGTTAPPSTVAPTSEPTVAPTVTPGVGATGAGATGAGATGAGATGAGATGAGATGAGATGAGATGAGATGAGATGAGATGAGATGAGATGTDQTGATGDDGTGPVGDVDAGSDPGEGDAGEDVTPPVDPDVLTVQLGEERQIIRGFGLNATLMKLDTAKPIPWNQLFTLEGADALGLSILRIGMAEGGGHRDVPSDWETARDLGARVIGSCWSAPPDWKDNNRQDTYGGGHLLESRYADWATRIATYANTNGLYAMSIANEADFASCLESEGSCVAPLTDQYASMVYTGKQMAEFVKVAGPIFDEIAPNTKMIAPEASLWIHVWSNLSPDGRDVPGAGYLSSDPLECNCYANEIDPTAAATCAPHCLNGENGELAEGGYDYGHWLASDPASWDAFDIMGVHQYETQVAYAWPDDVNGGVRDKEVWQTEMSGVMHWPEQGPSTDINNGLAVARWIHSALTVGEASAWLYWWYEAYYQNDNEGLAYVRNDQMNADQIAKRYYTMGNFSRYIRPDVFHAVRVAGPSPADVMVSAYKGDNDEVVIVAINETGQAVDIPIAITGGAVPAAMVPHVTTASDNWAEGSAVPVMDGSLQAALPSMSVTTFVSQ